MNEIVTPMMWGVFALFVLIALIVDFTVLRTNGSKAVSMKEAGIWSAVWVAVSAIFAGWLYWQVKSTAGVEVAEQKLVEFTTGYLIEKALSVDNIFVFLMVFTFFAVPPELQKRVLMIGILGALVLRAIMILIGAWLIAQFHWILYVFGAFLVITGVKMWFASDNDGSELKDNKIINWLKSHINVSDTFHGEKFWFYKDGVRWFTPLFLTIVMIAIVDIIFAVDSIPAIFAITTDPFIVLTSNVFAILGLRALYFLLAGLKEKFHLLSYGLAVVLAFIGVKMLLIDIYKIPVGISLGFTAATLFVTMLLSVWLKPTHRDNEV